jgi:protein kinase-like protein
VQPLVPGDPARIGDFVLLGRLGSGGMGRVYLGREPSGRKVAVKVVHAALLEEDSSFRNRFRHEVEAAKEVGGFWTPAIVDWDADAERPWYACAYIDAPTLHDVVRTSGPLDLRRIAALGAGLAAALAAVHRAGLVHRDLKPSNVMMADDGPRVIDFGIVRVLDGATRLTRTGVRLLSLGFAPPEQMRGAKVTTASDVFALGAVLVFAATGHLPFPGATEAAVDRRMDQPPDLDGVPVVLRDVLRRCLDREPGARPTVIELLSIFSRLSASDQPLSDSADQAVAPRPTLVDPDAPDRRLVPEGTPPRTREAAPPSARRVPEAAPGPSRPAAPAPAAAGSVVPPDPGGNGPVRTPPPGSSVRDARSGVPAAPTAARSTSAGGITPAACLVGAMTAGELHWLTGLSWWWAAPIGVGVVIGVAALLDVLRDDEDAGFGILLLIALLTGLGAGVLTHQRTGFAWWGIGLVGIGTAVGAFVLTMIGSAWAIDVREGPISTSAAVALASGVLLVALLIWAVGTAVWLATVLGAVTVVVLSALLTWLVSKPG